jgi:endo-1,4-beta-xylanase
MSLYSQNVFTSLFVSLLILSGCSSDVSSNTSSSTETTKGHTLKSAYADKFLIGATLNDDLVANPNHPSMDIVKRHFSAATMDNAMKWGVFNPQPETYNFSAPDNFVEFTAKNNIQAVGHVLYWHSQTPDWVFKDQQGNLLSRDALLNRMRERAKLMAARYGNTIKIWDVVNEAIEADGSLRKTMFNKIVGDDFIEQAFIIAAQELPKDSVFLYNDYGMTSPGRRDAVVALVNNLKAKNIKIDGIGVQGHWSMQQPSIQQISTSFDAFVSTGLPMHITELDVDYLGREEFFGANVDIEKRVATAQNNPYPNGNFPGSADQDLGVRYVDIFNMFLKYHKNIERITFWGVTDDTSWLNGWPGAGRTNYPLLFNSDGTEKQALKRVVQLGVDFQEE